MNPLNAHEWLFALTECFHIVGFAIAIGSTAIVDMQLLGLGFPGTTAAMAHKEMAPWTLGGVLLAISSGVLILSTDMPRYMAHPTMRLKLALLAVVLVFNYTAHDDVAKDPAAPGSRRLLVAIPSLALWVAVVFSGLFYAFS